MKKVLISSFDMEVGGVERSLISMLNNFDYDNYDVDLMLYSHTGEFMELLPKKPNLLEESKKYKTFRLSIGQTIKRGNFAIGIGRLAARYKAKVMAKHKNIEEPGCIQMQYMWKYTLPFLPKLEKLYDVAISYLWPHYFIADKVNAKTKIAWIHTDYSTIHTDVNIDLKMWDKFDYIVSISQDVTNAFLSKYPSLRSKIILVENITSPEFIRDMAKYKQNEIIKEGDLFNIVSVGRYCYQKAFDNAIKALRILHDRGYTNIKWYIVGYGEDEDLYKRLIKENKLEDSFILLGKKTNPYPYMKDCDLYVQPSRYEGKAVTVSEAQILGKPVVITNYTTSKSQIKHGIDGYICDLDANGIASGIEEVYHNEKLRKLISDNCKNTDYSNSSELKKLYEAINNKYIGDRSKCHNASR